MDNTTLTRFWEKVMKTDNCWLWIGARERGGYGCIQIKHNNFRAHRLSWELHHGTVPTGMHVLHTCDNPPCVNPTHLFLGTSLDNMADKVRKGRHSSTGFRKSVPWTRAIFRKTFLGLNENLRDLLKGG